MDEIAIDERQRASIARLTDNEKACLRRRLQHQTAKEMALELGISPHAVEKRLKMARTKLGLSSSLEAARLLEASERYQPTVPQSPDLDPGEFQEEKRPIRFLALGAFIMSLFVATLVAFAAHTPSSNEAALADSVGVERKPPAPSKSDFVSATAAEILVIIQSTFHALDKNRSGSLEGEESPLTPAEKPSPVYRRDEQGNAVETGEVILLTAAHLRDQFYAEADGNGDGKVALHEYRRWATPRFVKQGIPAEWKDDINRRITD